MTDEAKPSAEASEESGFLIAGNVVAMATPFNEKGELMADACAELARWHVESGAGALFIAGDNGEAWALDPAELRRLTETVVATAAREVPVFVGTVRHRNIWDIWACFLTEALAYPD